MHEGSVWDAYILGHIMWQHMRVIYLPATNISNDDEACERLRACVHQVTTMIREEGGGLVRESQTGPLPLCCLG